ncbi:MAG: hypothetical protein RL307_797 [Pseudomonadota bacterium]
MSPVSSTQLTFPERVQHEEARFALTALRGQLQAGAKQSVSLAQLKTFDSSALALMLALQRSARAQSGELTWMDVPPLMQSLAQVYGVMSLLGLEAPSH